MVLQIEAIHSRQAHIQDQAGRDMRRHRLEKLIAVVDTVTCTVEGQCVQGGAARVNIPHFIDVDVAQKQLRQVGAERTSEIKQVARQNGQLVLQGVEENGRGWTLSISETSGSATLTVSGDQSAYVVFSRCTPR